MSQQVVAQAKQQLEAEGADLTGPCGAWQITNRAAYILRNDGAGILSKPSGNNCQGYSVDVIIYRDGRAFDVLVDGGGANTPAWNQIEPIDPGRWREPIAPVPIPGPGPVPDPPPSLEQRLKAIEDGLVLVFRTQQELQMQLANLKFPEYTAPVDITHSFLGHFKGTIVLKPR